MEAHLQQYAEAIEKYAQQLCIVKKLKSDQIDKAFVVCKESIRLGEAKEALDSLRESLQLTALQSNDSFETESFSFQEMMITYTDKKQALALAEEWITHFFEYPTIEKLKRLELAFLIKYGLVTETA